MVAWVLVVGSYLLGSIPTSVWVGRFFFGVDVRTRGSGNAGGTNTLRTLGWGAGIAVMAVDVGKGVVAAMLPALTQITGPRWLPVACLIAAVGGHVFPVFADFRGGKGVATGAGALVVLAPVPAAACAVVWFVLLAATRVVSVAAAVALPIAVASLPGRGPEGLLPASVGLAAFVVWTHRANLRRLRRGEEPRTTVARKDGR
ncbi:MAG: glycerol-3-phosphate 1-O-acyltransferase PlsY [Acidobacteriota bacterium]